MSKDGSVKIAWFGHIPTPRGNGLVTYSRELPKGLRRRGQDVYFFYHDSREQGQPSNGHTIRVGGLNILDRVTVSTPGARAMIEQTLERERIDVAHVSLSFSQLDFSLPAICHAHGVPLVGTLHFPFGPRTTFWGSATRLLYRAFSRALSKYDAIIVFGERQRTMLIRYGVPPNRIRVIPNGVDTNTFAPGPSDYKQAINASLLVTYVGRVDPEKNVDKVLDAFLELELPRDHKLVVVGNGADLARLKRKANGDPRIILRGYVGDLAERVRILRAADIYVLPSSIEGLSMALLEAMASETAIIATDVGADADALRGAGLVIDLGAIKTQLPYALKLLIDHPDWRRDLAARARGRAIQEYSIETNIDRVFNLYCELLEHQKEE